MKALARSPSLRSVVVVPLFCAVLAFHARAEKMSLAIMTLKNASGITDGEASLITDRLGVELFNTGRVNVMERNQMQEILKEQGFQQSGACTDEECLVEVGQMLGVEGLVSGSIGKLGSMYLINLRVINVSTARITHVVSEDVTGGIEQVVVKLKSIARQLVGQAVAAEKNEEATPQPKPQPKAQPEPEPEPAAPPEPSQPSADKEPAPDPATPVAEPSDSPEQSPPLSEREERNRNRAGLRIVYSPAFGTARIDYEHSFLGERELVEDVNEPYYDRRSDSGYTVEHTHYTRRARLVLMAPAGKFLAVDIGAGILLFRERWESERYDDKDDDDLQIVAPHISTGFAFVKRFYPVKINAGVTVDINLNFISYEWLDYDPYFGEFDHDAADSRREVDFGMSVSFGPRVGIELLAGSHVGFGAEFVYRYYRCTSTIDLLGNTDSNKYQFRLPGVGINTGVSFYF
ncbi:MAG: hypothetical protein GF331_06710 [Chitinivibrionales bacterium]|nr:hypothetical protein [Chitinivibrionales bacterium]